MQNHKKLFLRTSFIKVDGFFKVYDGTRFLVLFGSEKYDAIYNRIKYLINLERHEPLEIL